MASDNAATSTRLFVIFSGPPGDIRQFNGLAPSTQFRHGIQQTYVRRCADRRDRRIYRSESAAASLAVSSESDIVRATMSPELPFPQLKPIKDPGKVRRSFERRGAPRYAFIAPVRWSGGEGRTVNISTSGILFESTVAVEPKTALRITIANPFGAEAEPRYVFCDVIVVRVEPAPSDRARFHVAGTIAGMRFH